MRLLNGEDKPSENNGPSEGEENRLGKNDVYLQQHKPLAFLEGLEPYRWIIGQATRSIPASCTVARRRLIIGSDKCIMHAPARLHSAVMT